MVKKNFVCLYAFVYQPPSCASLFQYKAVAEELLVNSRRNTNIVDTEVVFQSF